MCVVGGEGILSILYHHRSLRIGFEFGAKPGALRLFHEVQIRGGRSLEGGYGLDLQERVWICVC